MRPVSLLTSGAAISSLLASTANGEFTELTFNLCTWRMATLVVTQAVVLFLDDFAIAIVISHNSGLGSGGVLIQRLGRNLLNGHPIEALFAVIGTGPAFVLLALSCQVLVIGDDHHGVHGIFG